MSLRVSELMEILECATFREGTENLYPYTPAPPTPNILPYESFSFGCS